MATVHAALPRSISTADVNHTFAGVQGGWQDRIWGKPPSRAALVGTGHDGSRISGKMTPMATSA